MAHVELSHVDYYLPDGRALLRDVSLKVSDHDRVALIGPNGVGKSTLLRLLLGDEAPDTGHRSQAGSVGVMPQFIGQAGSTHTVRELLLATAAPRIIDAARAVEKAEARMRERGDQASQMAYAHAITAWGDLGGYDEENRWETVTLASIGASYDQVARREARTLSGGEQRRIVLEALRTSSYEILVLDEPDNFLDIPGKVWLETLISEARQGILFVSHDRQLVARCARSIATLERGAAGATLWLHGEGFSSYAEARKGRILRFEELKRRWLEEEQKLKDLVQMYKNKAAYNSDMASRLQAARTRLEKFRAEGPPEEAPREEKLAMQLRGAGTAKKAVVIDNLAIDGLIEPFSTEVWLGDRVAILGDNGTGKSHLLGALARAQGNDESPDDYAERIAAVPEVSHGGAVRLGSRVLPGYFSQTHSRHDLEGRTLLEILQRGDRRRPALDRGAASGALNRYGLLPVAQHGFTELSGGQRARFQILLLELSGATLLLLDEPTENLDLESADALEAALGVFHGSIIAVTHDRWFAKMFDRFLVVGNDGQVTEVNDPVW